MEVYSDDYFMTRALDLAMQAYGEQEVPIGAVVVHNNKIIGKGYNQTEVVRVIMSKECSDVELLHLVTLIRAIYSGKISMPDQSTVIRKDSELLTNASGEILFP